MGLEYIIKAKEDIKNLQEKKNEMRKEHRGTVTELKGLGVNESQAGSSKRSKTFSEVLGPIEDEIKKIAEEVTKIREENDLQPSRLEMLRERQGRLVSILREMDKRFNSIVEKYKEQGQSDINKTEEGRKFYDDYNRLDLLKESTNKEISSILDRSNIL